ncbi:MAG: hypothetical protein WBX25_16360 [Rhodomicrobium sp.]
MSKTNNAMLSRPFPELSFSTDAKNQEEATLKNAMVFTLVAFAASLAVVLAVVLLGEALLGVGV